MAHPFLRCLPSCLVNSLVAIFPDQAGDNSTHDVGFMVGHSAREMTSQKDERANTVDAAPFPLC